LISISLWLWILGLGVLFALLYQNYLRRMFFIATSQWGGDWSHALLVPLISGYFIYQNRQRLAGTRQRVYGLGLVIMYLGMGSFAWWIYPGRNDMFQGYSMILSLFGLVLFLLGPSMMKTLWVPIVYLLFAVKVADRVWDQIAWQLQQIAAKSATIALQFVSVDASVEGSTIKLAFMHDGHLVTEALNVAEACSGLRMLMAFVALGAAMAYLVERAWWQRAIMLILTVPIAVMVNVGRVSVLGLLYLYDAEMAAGDFHVFVGMLMLIPAAGMFWLVSWILDRIMIEDGSSGEHEAGEKAPVAAAATTPNIEPGRSLGLAVTKGLLAGGVMTALLGVEFGLLLASFRPQDIFAGALNSTVIIMLFVGGFLLLGAVGWFIHRLMRVDVHGQSAVIGTSRGIVAGVLLVAVLGLNGVVQATRTVLIKKSVPLRQPLYLIPDRAGQWLMINQDKRLPSEQEEVLGTKYYISRSYRDSTQRGRFVQLHVAYYTGTPDTVPHVPDRCFVAGGLQPIGKSTTSVNLSGSQYRQDQDQWVAQSRLDPKGVAVPGMSIDATIFTFAQPDNPDSQSNVIYFFIANGKFLPTPDRVRLQGFDPRDRYSYYCKVEVRVPGVAKTTEATEIASGFLSQMLPEVLACVPDWEEVTAGLWPTREIDDPRLPLTKR